MTPIVLTIAPHLWIYSTALLAQSLRMSSLMLRAWSESLSADPVLEGSGIGVGYTPASLIGMARDRF